MKFILVCTEISVNVTTKTLLASTEFCANSISLQSYQKYNVLAHASGLAYLAIVIRGCLHEQVRYLHLLHLSILRVPSADSS